jgi:protein-S-isoprenylcysteine O-methyltransferase Ste14
MSIVNAIRGVAYLGVLVALLFGSAGRWDLPFFWAYIGVNALLGLMLFVGGPLYVGHLVVAGLDAGRFHWSHGFSVPIQLVATAAFAAGWGFVTWAVIVNRFFSPVVRIQQERGHHLITSGPYRFVRHPGYAARVRYKLVPGIW